MQDHATSGCALVDDGACPLSAVTAKHPEVCALAQALVEEITGLTVTECCERTDSPKCGFRIDRETKSKEGALARAR